VGRCLGSNRDCMMDQSHYLIAVCLLFPVLSLHIKPSPHLLYIEALLLFRNIPRSLWSDQDNYGFSLRSEWRKGGPYL
jgi:hypothetical protein